ncbi:MAG: NIPSNAP family protein [Chloroflexi bacterium]|nr:NIPSNAP family protein [Chloroflexota bacterium]
MIYEMRTYNFFPGGLAQFEEGFARDIPHRLKYSKLGALWRTEIGPLNQAIHVWPYRDMQHRAEVRAAAEKDPHWSGPRAPFEVYASTEIEIYNPAPFMRPWDEDQELGNVYEMRSYICKPGSIGEMIERWAECIPHREKYSPLAACWYTEIGVGSKWVHVWPYASLAERDRIRAEAAKDPHWPPPTSY